MTTTSTSILPASINSSLIESDIANGERMIHANHNNNNDVDANAAATMITVGRLVEVASRTWPGINKPGGVGRITRVYYDDEKLLLLSSSLSSSTGNGTPIPTHVDVSYMVGRSREKRVPMEYVSLAPQYETATTTTKVDNTSMAMDGPNHTNAAPSLPPRRSTGLRDRNLLLGRCRRCGSLRTDCGSCDWATEEQQQQQQALPKSNTISSTGRSKLTSRNKRGSKISSGSNSAEEDSSDTSDDSETNNDDDMALQELLRTSRQKYRRHLRHRQRWNNLWESTANNNNNKNKNDDDDADKHSKIHQPDVDAMDKATEELGADTDDSDEDLDELWEQSQRRYRQHVRQRIKWRRRLQATNPMYNKESSSMTVNTRRPYHRSVLETLDDSTHPTTNIIDKRRRKIHKDGSRRVTMESCGNTKTDTLDRNELEDSSSLRLAQKSTWKKNKDEHEHASSGLDNKGSPIGVPESSPIGVPESSSPESMQNDRGFMAMNDDNEDEESSMEHMPVAIQRHPFFSATRNNTDHNRLMDDMGPEWEYGDPDDTFIQPEGQDAAENLPRDMVDRTESIPYSQLPDFFQDLATELEDDLIPDFRLKIAELQRQHRRVTSPRRPTWNVRNDNHNTVSDLLQQCQQLWGQVTRQLIRNGTDQCRASLRRLSDDRAFRKQRKHLTAKQRKQIRGTVAMEARHLRLDALETSVEDLVRTLKTVTMAVEGLQQSEGDKEEISTGLASESEHDDEEYETQDLIPMRHMEDTDGGRNFIDPSERSLGEFDPHQHATKRRTEKRSRKEGQRSRQTEITSADRQRVPKRARVLSSNALDNFVVEDKSLSRRASASRSTRGPGAQYISTTGPSGPSRTRKYRATRSSSLRSKHSAHPNELGEEDGRHPSNASDEDEDDHSLIAIDGEDENDVTTFAFVSAEAEKACPGDSNAVHSSQMSCNRPQRVAASKARKFSNSSMSFPSSKRAEISPRRDRIPISVRMQHFLDNNNDLNWHNNENDSTVWDLVSRVDTGERRNADRKNRASSHQFNTGNNEFPKEGRTTRAVRPTDDSERATGEHGASHNNNQLDVGDPIPTSYFLHMVDSASMAVDEPATTHVPNQYDCSRSLHNVERNQVVNNQTLSSTSHSNPRKRSVGYAESVEDTGGAIEMLRGDGRTLTEMIAFQSPELRSHVETLSIFVREEYAGNNRDDLRELVLLQLVDAVYALTHPSAWALKIPNRIRVLQSLEALRDALAAVMPITEKVCHCIIECLPSQEWRTGADGSCGYVSSINPDMWKRFYDMGEYTSHQIESRYRNLGKVWPRVEVDTAWNILFFFGATGSSCPDATSQSRWQMVSKLFTSSVLVKSPMEELHLPPNPAQLSAFDSDIDKFLRLLRKGALDELPPTDKLMTNVIKNAITLQAEDYLRNEESRFRSFPTIGTGRAPFKLVSRLWKSMQSVMEADATLVSRSDRFLSVFDTDFRLENQSGAPKLCNALQPGSRLLGGCLSLLVAWAGRVPKKKVRQARFLKQLKSLRSSLRELEQGLLAQSSGDLPRDDFGNEFHNERPIEVGDACSRMSIFIGEASANIWILEAVLSESSSPSIEGFPRTKGLYRQNVQELWDSLSFDALEKHRLALLGGSADMTIDSVDPLKVFVCAKVMAAVALLCMEQFPWCLTAAYPRKRLALGVEASDEMLDYYAFPLSCVLVCLDYLSQREDQNKALLCRVLSILTSLFNQLTLIKKIGEANCLVNQISSQAGTVYLPVLMRCFRRHLKSCEGRDGHILLSLILGAILGVSNFKVTLPVLHWTNAIIQSDVAPQRSQHSGINDEFFDDLADDVFAAIEMEAPPALFTREQKSESYSSTMIEVLERLKPSERFKISTAVNRDVLQMSPHSEYILSKEVGKVCDCLVAIAAAQRHMKTSDSHWYEFVPLLKRSTVLDADAHYHTKISSRLTARLCSTSSYDNGCRTFVRRNVTLFLSGILHTILDTNRLEVFPSCYFHLVRWICGETAARGALVALDVFNGDDSSKPVDIDMEKFQSIVDFQRRQKAKAEAPWKSLEHFSDALSGELESPLATVLKTLDSDLPSGYSRFLEVSSLEKECFSCFLLQRNIISFLSRHSKEEFEETASQIVGFLSCEMLRILHGLRYFEQTGHGDSQESEEGSDKTKIVALFYAYSELFLATTSWILRETPSNTTKNWNVLQRLLCERIFFPLLRRHTFDMAFNLKVIVAECRSAAPSGTASVSSGFSLTTFSFDPLFDMAVRRCRQLVVAPIQSSVLHAYLIEGLLKVEAEEEAILSEVIGHSFNAIAPVRPESTKGPLQQEIDRYLNLVESSLPHDNWREDMARKRLETVRNVLIPKIAQRKADMATKGRILRVASHIFAFKHAFSDGPEDTDIVEFLTSFVRPVRQTIFECLKSKTVDDNFVSVALSFCRSLALLEMLNPVTDELLPFFTWSVDQVSPSDSVDSENFCPQRLGALYVRCFFGWIYSLCSEIAHGSKPCSPALFHVRRLCCMNGKSQNVNGSMLQRLISARIETNANSQLDVWTNALTGCEDQLFQSKSENVRPVVNVYAKTAHCNDASSSLTNDGVLEEWTPSSCVTRSAKECMAALLSISA